ncbi:MAG: DUF1616 domain-containing protein [Dehalococcoidales bacterium]|nr:DUF1616 domain-containing protein [Dehalococcoidales bacterium]
MMKVSGVRDKVLAAVLIAAVAGAAGMLGYTIAHPPNPERYTEFYILGPEGKAADYPQELAVGEEGRVIVGIVNREQAVLSYRLEIRTDGVISGRIEGVQLGPDQKWEEEVAFIPDRIGDRQKVEFLLYRQGEGAVYESLYLWVDVGDVAA